MICDPEREYYALGQALGGEVIRIAAGSPDHINAMDMVEGYGDGGNPVVDKSEFILSLFEQLDRGGIGPLQKSIIDRCVDAVYAAYKRGGPVPTLRVLREKLLAQPEEEARDLALALELFTTGSLDAFAHETNVDTQNRIVIYDIMDLGRQLKTMGLLIITDAMLNRVTETGARASGRTCSSTNFMWSFRIRTARISLIPHGVASVNAVPIPPPLRRMWSICWIPFRPAPCCRIPKC